MEAFRPLKEIPRPDRLTPWILVITGLILAGCLYFLGQYWWSQRTDVGPKRLEAPELPEAPEPAVSSATTPK